MILQRLLLQLREKLASSVTCPLLGLVTIHMIRHAPAVSDTVIDQFGPSPVPVIQ